MALEFYQNHFRSVIEPKRNDAVSKTPADLRDAVTVKRVRQLTAAYRVCVQFQRSVPPCGPDEQNEKDTDENTDYFLFREHLLKDKLNKWSFHAKKALIYGLFRRENNLKSAFP